METWFEVWNDKIMPVQVDKHTEGSVWVHGQRRRRISWRSYFSTWDEAHRYLVLKVKEDLAAARLALERQQGRLGNVTGMRPAQT